MKFIKSYISIDHDTDVIKLDSNESYISMSSELHSIIKSTLGLVELNRYPENNNYKIRSLYANYAGEGITQENIIAGCGSDEMLGLVIGATIGKNRNLLSLSPDFSMYEYYVSLNDGNVIKFETAKDGYVDVDAFIEQGKREKINLIIFSNPNNPTGYALSCGEIEKILTAFKDTYVIVDEAYYEFNGESMIKYINKYDNLIVTRTLSKAWGLAALRVGFLISNKENINKLNSYKVPFNISSLSQAAAEVALENISRLKEDTKVIVDEREMVYKELKEIEKEAALEIEFYSSKGNYIFGRTPYKDALFAGLKKDRIIIRNFEDDSFRITIGSSFENNLLIESLKGVFIYGEK